MALNTQNAVATSNAGVDAIVALANAGKLQLYDGTQPAAGGAVAAQVKLAEFTLPNPAFGAAAARTATANAISAVNAIASGTATWFRVLSSGSAILWDGSIGTSGANMNMNSNVISSGASVSVTSWTYTIPAQGS